MVTPLQAIFNPAPVAPTRTNAANFGTLLALDFGSFLDTTTAVNDNDFLALLNVADTVTLSPAAQNIINTQASQSFGNGFTLDADQQTKFDEIIDSHKGEAFTPENFNQIIDQLTAAGLGPDQLATQDQIDQLTTSGIFADSFSSASTDSNDLDFSSLFDSSAGIFPTSEQANINSYLLQILNQWQSISLVA